LLEQQLQRGLSGRIAAPTRMPGGPLIAADEKVSLELRHENNLQEIAAAKGLVERKHGRGRPCLH